MGTLVARFFRKPSSPGVVVIRRDSDGYLWDFDDSEFTATPATGYSVPTEDTNYPGMYLFELVQTWTGLYQLFWYATSAKTTKPLVLPINLTSGARDDPYSDLAESVRLELDATPVDVNVFSVNSIEIGGSGTALDPWGPAT